MDRFRRIREGMTEQEVRRILGSPGEVRLIERDHLLDGIVVASSRTPDIQETHRWAYGVRRPGSFAHGGVVSFDAMGCVLGAQFPLSEGNSFAALPPQDQTVAAASDLSCHLTGVRFEEARGESVRLWFATVTVTNGGQKEFVRDCFVDSIARLSVIEVYDRNKKLIFREDRSGINNGFASRSSTFALAAGASKTEEVAFIPDSYFGPLLPGVYFLRVHFQNRPGSFIVSNFCEMSVPKAPERSSLKR
jgi:hypothetical protein